MKRSEMELNIATNIVITKPYIDFKEAQALAEIALISVLENGMLPPLNDWSLHTDGDKANSDNVRYYTWESEDETI